MISDITRSTTEQVQSDSKHDSQKKLSKQIAKKTWTLDEIRQEGSIGFRAFDILTSAAFSALRRNDNSRKGITSKTRLTAEDVIEMVKEFRERLEWTEEDMEYFLEDNREAADKLLKMISEE
jgi:hypothetical protein